MPRREAMPLRSDLRPIGVKAHFHCKSLAGCSARAVERDTNRFDSACHSARHRGSGVVGRESEWSIL
jgi:hypothetical protein